jgi:hypothetical protein
MFRGKAGGIQHVDVESRILAVASLRLAARPSTNKDRPKTLNLELPKVAPSIFKPVPFSLRFLQFCPSHSFLTSPYLPSHSALPSCYARPIGRSHANYTPYTLQSLPRGPSELFREGVLRTDTITGTNTIAITSTTEKTRGVLG